MNHAIKALLFEALRNSGNRFRVHGNGFLQLDLDQRTRLNFWGHPLIPRQKVDTGWHDHRFSFVSTVLKGTIYERRYDAVSSATPHFMAYQAHPGVGEDTKLVKINQGYDLRLRSQNTVRQGEEYMVSFGEIHYTEVSEPTVTCIEKTTETGRPVTVYCPIGLEPDNDFNRHAFDQERLRDIAYHIVNN